MVTVKDRGEEIELTILLPVVKKEYRNVYEKDGFTPKDLQSYGFNIRMTRKDYIDFLQDIVKEHVRFATEAAQKAIDEPEPVG